MLAISLDVFKDSDLSFYYHADMRHIFNKLLTIADWADLYPLSPLVDEELALSKARDARIELTKQLPCRFQCQLDEALKKACGS